MTSFLGILRRKSKYLTSAASGAGMFAAVDVVDRLLRRFHLSAEATILDDVLLGMLVALLVFSIEVLHERKMREQQEKLSVAIAMNHQIRNALQIIVYANVQNPDKEAKLMIREAASKIERALHEILPANDRTPPTPKPSIHQARR